ncbi:hypothetical protein QBC32DRAFT_40748 [Pseudoneurospora amorphoporcata]|uniref:Histone-lysine N-methyltransferase n=1 Tax=Pseudoneurospora amorphoporcata TaxID=241081 RepID=A0AAN6NNQ5_9PEZI|nr:hypothetical protein QBC32DRAFT_40748 [Pseudoneurospora amorphoporcata]
MAAIVAIAELARGLLSSDSSFVSAVSAPTDASIEASSDAPASLTSTPPTTVSPDNMSQISDADVSGKPDTISVPCLESAIPFLEDEQQNQAHQQLQQEQQGAGQGIAEAQPDAIVVVPQQPADPSLPDQPNQQPGPDSTGRFPRRARGNNAPIYNLARLTGTYVHGKRASKGDIVLQKKRKPKGRKLQALLAQQALEAEQAAQAALLLASRGRTLADPAANIQSVQPANQETDKPNSNAPVDAPTNPSVHAPAAPEPTIPESTVPEPTIPEPEIPEVAASPDKNGAAQPPEAPAEENRVDHETLDASMDEAPLGFPTDTAELSSTTNADTAQIIHPYTSDTLAPALPADVPGHIPPIAPSATTKPSTRGPKATKKEVIERPVGRPKKRTATNTGKPSRTARAEEAGKSTVDEAVISSPKEAQPSVEKEAEPSSTEDGQTGTWEDVPEETNGDVQTSPAKQVKAVKARGIKTTKDKATKAVTIKASVVVPAMRRATRHSGVPVEDPLLSLIPPAPGKKTKKTAEPAVTRVPRELKRLRDTNEFVGIDTRPIRYSVWSNGKYIEVTEEREPTAPAKKKPRVESSTTTVREDKKEKTVEPEAPMNTESSRLVDKQKRVKKWLNKGLYAGQQAPEDVTKSLTTQERKKLLTIPELAKSCPPNKVLPLPIFNGLRLLIAGRDFKLPFDVCHPLPPGQPKPAAYRTMTKNRFIGQAAAIWKKTPHFEDFASKCVCTPEDGCAQDCQNRVMLYECDETNCNIGKEFCQNRAFQMLTERTKQGGRYRVGVEVFKTEDRGYGVRSNRCFEPHQIIMEYTGEIITDEECERRMNEEYKNNECYYLMSFDQNMIIDATTGSIARFVNHSCSPNCRMIKWIVSGQPRMALFAGDRPIQTGEELTYDYNFDPFSAKNVQKCLCGAPNCRGVLGPKPKEVKPPKPPKAEGKGKKKAAKRKLQELLANGVIVEGEGKSPKKLKVDKSTEDTAKGAATFLSRKVSKVSVSAKSKTASAKTTKTFTRKVSIASTKVVKSFSKKGAAAKSKMITLKAPTRGSNLTIVAADAGGSITAAGTTEAEEEVGNRASRAARVTPKNTPRAKKMADAVQETPAAAEGDGGSIFDVPSSSSARKRAPSWKVRDSGVKNVSSLFKKARKSPVKSKDTASPAAKSTAAVKVVKPRKASTLAKVTKPGKAMPKLTVAKKAGKSVTKATAAKSGKGSVGTLSATKIRLVSKLTDGQDENAAPEQVEA